MATRSAPRRWLVLVAIWAIPGILTTSQMYLLSAAVKGDGVTLAQAFIARFLPWQVWALATPLIVHVRRRYPLERAGWWRAVLAHLALCAVVAIADTWLSYGFGRLADQAPYNAYSAATMLPPMLVKGAFLELFIYAAVLAVDFGLEYRDRYHASALRQSQLEAKLVETHLDALKAQLRPHFLFNTLNAISVMTRKGDTAGAVKMIDGLGDLLRRSLTTARVERVTLDEELDFIQRYLDIVTTRFSDRLRARIDAGAAARAALVPSLLLQPIVENAIEHGLAPCAAGGQLEIIAWIEGAVLHIEVRDDGVGLSGPAPRYGVGLAHVRDRLAQLYPGQHRFALEPRTPAGAVAVLALPLEAA